MIQPNSGIVRHDYDLGPLTRPTIVITPQPARPRRIGSWQPATDFLRERSFSSKEIDPLARG